MQRLPPSPTPSLSSADDEPEPPPPRARFRWPWRQPAEPPPPASVPAEHISIAVAERSRDPFAREVCITGWKVVGGRSFDDTGRLGAYVGESPSRLLLFLPSVRRARDSALWRDDSAQQAVHAVCPAAERAKEDLSSGETRVRANTDQHLVNAIPELPRKHVSKFDPAFLEDRRPRLQWFLRAVMLHPEMGVGGDTVLGRWILDS